jgi:MFS family permease
MSQLPAELEGPSEGPPGRRASRLRTFSALRHRDYRFLWLGNSFSSAANWVQQVTLALLVADLTDSSPFWVATVLGIRALPVLLIGPLAGVAVDRLDRRKLLMFTQLVLAAIAFLFAVGVALDEVNKYHALIFSFLLGADLSVIQPVRLALIANVVPREDLTNALALENSAGNILRILGPAASLALMTPFGFAGNFFIQAGAYLAVFLIVIPLRTPYRERVAEGGSVAGDFMEGLRYIRGDTTLLLLIVLIIIPSVFVHSTQNLLVIFAREILPGDEKVVLGSLFASLGAGSLVATILTASLGDFRAKGAANLASVLLVSFLLALFGLSSNLALSVALFGVLGVFNQGYRIMNNSLVQSRIPDSLRGRINSIYVIDHGIQPLGSPLLGLLAVGLGAGHAVAVAGLVAFVSAAFIALRWRHLWRLA